MNEKRCIKENGVAQEVVNVHSCVGEVQFAEQIF